VVSVGHHVSSSIAAILWIIVGNFDITKKEAQECPSFSKVASATPTSQWALCRHEFGIFAIRTLALKRPEGAHIIFVTTLAPDQSKVFVPHHSVPQIQVGFPDAL
jgi:hypothetical protein